MKRTTIYIGIAILLVGTATFYYVRGTSATTYTYTADPNYPSDKIAFETTWDHGILCQSFRPTTTTLANYVDLMVDGYERDPAQFTVDLRLNAPEAPEDTNLPGESLGTYTASTIGAKPTGYTASLEMTRFTNSSVTEVSVDTSKKYWLCMTGSGSYDHDTDGDIGWYGDPTGSYAGGEAFTLGPPFGFDELGAPTRTVDLGFAVYNKVAQADPPPAEEEETPAPADPTPAPTTPTATTTPSTTTTTTTTPTSTSTSSTSSTTSSTTSTTTSAPSITQQTGITAGSGAAPAAPTASIKAPAELAVTDFPSDQGGALKLDWKASATADIDGYKVFRSTEEKKNFTEVAKTEKTILTFTDPTATIGTQFYYLVRAYKGTGESASSNTVNGTSVDNLVPAVPQNFTYQNSSGSVTLVWDKNSDADLSGYVLSIATTADKATIIESIEIGKEANSYMLKFADHTKLASDGSYEFSLAAKDVNNNVSEKAIASAKQAEAADTVATTSNQDDGSPVVWYVIGGILALVLAGGGVYWLKFKKVKVSKTA